MSSESESELRGHELGGAVKLELGNGIDGFESGSESEISNFNRGFFGEGWTSTSESEDKLNFASVDKHIYSAIICKSHTISSSSESSRSTSHPHPQFGQGIVIVVTSTLATFRTRIWDMMDT
jgi:hypothetical protein